MECSKYTLDMPRPEVGGIGEAVVEFQRRDASEANPVVETRPGNGLAADDAGWTRETSTSLSRQVNLLGQTVGGKSTRCEVVKRAAGAEFADGRQREREREQLATSVRPAVTRRSCALRPTPASCNGV
jgi:hypothetical protein